MKSSRPNVKLIVATGSITIFLTGCGTFQLSSGAVPLSYKTQDQMQIDNLSCKDQAKLEANTAERQAGAFALGLTIVGVPLAYELEKSKQREVYKSCMEKRGYRVLPPKDAPESTTTAKPIPQPTPPAAQLAMPMPVIAPVPPPAIKAPEAIVQPATQNAPSLIPRDEASQLQKIKELRDKGLITSEEYEKKRREIIDRL